jgi:hypothetical protein
MEESVKTRSLVDAIMMAGLQIPQTPEFPWPNCPLRLVAPIRLASAPAPAPALWRLSESAVGVPPGNACRCRD